MPADLKEGDSVWMCIDNEPVGGRFVRYEDHPSGPPRYCVVTYSDPALKGTRWQFECHVFSTWTECKAFGIAREAA